MLDLQRQDCAELTQAMADECNQEAVLSFIQEKGGRVKNADLSQHFRATIPTDPALKQAAREAFKRCVDRVAFVKEEDGEKYVCLRKTFRRGEGMRESGGKEGMLPGSGYRESHHVTESDMGNSSSQKANECESALGKEEKARDLSEVCRGGELRNSVCVEGRFRDAPRPDADCEHACVTLEPLEHDWMMRAADGLWENLQPLLLRDPSLIARRDFITGFTCLHWAAKLGKHELIATLANFAKAREVALDVNARSSAGYTPLHLAAMHNHPEVVKLLVGAFDADVEARDYSGRRACQYLKSDMAQDILEIAGACEEPEQEDGGDAGRWRLSRVIQSSFRPLKAQNHTSVGEDAGGVARKPSLRRKSSFTKMRPSLNKIRLRSQIVHSTSLLDRFEKDPTEQTPRPKSYFFG